MRALVFGLVGVLAGVGGAEAAQCVVAQKPTQVYAAAGPAQHPEWAGQVFHVVRSSSQRADTFVEARGTTMRLGYEAYEIKGRAGSFTIRRDYVPGTPSVQTVSYDNAPADVKWGTGNAKISFGDHILDGPLSDLVMMPHACRE